MSLFLDTNALLWWLGAERLTPQVVDRIDNESPVFVSVVSPWEIWIKVANGKLALPRDFDADLGREDALTVLSPTLDDARLATALPLIHRDPFDRMIVAQALNRGATLVTSDRGLSRYGVRILQI